MALSLLEPAPFNPAADPRSAEECITDSVSAEELVDCALDDPATDAKVQALFADPDLDDEFGI